MNVLTVIILLSLASFSVSKNVDPYLKIYPSSSPNLAPTGSPYILTCKGEKEHPDLFDDLRWEDPRGQIIKQGVRLISGSLLLQFDRPTLEDSGEYTCRGSVQKSNMLEAKTRVEFFNEITMECPEHQSLLEGASDQIIVCKISAQPSPTVEWIKDNKPLSAYQGAYDFLDGRITINRPVKKEDAGEYVVTATVLENGRMKVRSIITEVYSQPKIISNNITDYLGVKSESIELSCKADGYPLPRISWFDPSTRNVSSEGGYIVNPETGQLKITNIQARDNGTFECIASNPAGLAKSRVSLFVASKPEIISFENKTVDEDGFVDIECRSFGIPSPRISIRPNGQQPLALGQSIVHTIENKYDGETTALKVRLRAVTRNYDSIYYCSSENSAGKVERIGHLKVRFAPDITGTPKEQWIKPGKMSAVTCFVKAFPEPTITWFKDNIILTNQEYEMSVDPSLNTHTLTIKAAQSTRNSYGLYKCHAKNQMGEKEVNIELKQAHSPSRVDFVEFLQYPTHLKITMTGPFDDGGAVIKYYHITYSGESIPQNTYHSKHFGNQTFPYIIPDKNTRKSGPYVIQNLRPEYNYLLRIFSENDVGRSDFLETSAQTLRATVPDAPMISTPDRLNLYSSNEPLKSIYSNGYKLTWSPPMYDNGDPIDHYIIRYYEVHYMNSQWTSSDSSSEKEITHTKNRPESVEIGDLKSNTNYMIEVRAHNTMGISEPAKIVIQTNAHGGPSIRNFDDHTALSLFYLTPSNGVIFLIMIVLIILLVLVDATCCFKYQVGLLSVLRNWCCTSDRKVESSYPTMNNGP